MGKRAYVVIVFRSLMNLQFIINLIPYQFGLVGCSF